MQKNFVKKLDFCSYIFVGVFKVNDKNIRDLRIWIRTTPKCHGSGTPVLRIRIRQIRMFLA